MTVTQVKTGRGISFDRWWRLSVMMFLVFAIWGAWSPILGAYLGNQLHFNGDEIGVVFSLLPLATIFAPMIFGQLADRYLSSEYILAALSLAGAVLLWVMSGVHDYQPFLWVMLVYSLLFAPTLILANSISFDHLSDSSREFGLVRVGGTVGWMVAGYLLTLWLHLSHTADQSNCLRLAAIFSLILGIFSFLIPHTPPKREGTEPLAFLKALRMLREPSFLVFILISFVVATELMFYYILTAPFLEYMGVDPQNTSSVLTIAQGAELFVMAGLLPLLLPRWGVRKIMVIGILAWPIRYAIFAICAHMGHSMLWLVEAALVLHGFCYVFFFVVGFIYVDMVAAPDIRASAQSLIGVVSMGIGLWIGSLLAGWIEQTYTTGSHTNWTGVFLIPCGLTVFCAIIFPLLFRQRS